MRPPELLGSMTGGNRASGGHLWGNAAGLRPTADRLPFALAILFGGAALQLGCGPTGTDDCAVASVASALVGGAAQTGYLGLSAAEAQAVVAIELDPNRERGVARDLCTGVALTSELVMTAAHCFVDSGAALRISSGGFSANVLAADADVFLHSTLDLALLRVRGLGAPVALPWAGREPRALQGALVEIAGAGISDAGTPGSVTFAIATVETESAEELVVRLVGEGGPCRGDSGGPLLVRGAGGSVEVAGVLARGAPSCRGPDSYSRVQAASDWIAAIAGEPPKTTASACETLGHAGRCFGDTAVYCEDGEQVGVVCAGGSSCGWDKRRRGYRCVAPETDPCRGVTDLGTCVEHRARRCVDGALQELSCPACGGVCTISPTNGKASCR